MTQIEKEADLLSVFSLGDAMFGIPALQVQEVVQQEGLTPVHQAHSTISGIINLRGQIVTVIDLAERLELEGGEKRHILIVDWEEESVGLLVDSVRDVLEADFEAMHAAPANVGQAQQKYFKGVCEVGGWLVAILDLDALLFEDTHEA